MYRNIEWPKTLSCMKCFTKYQVQFSDIKHVKKRWYRKEKWYFICGHCLHKNNIEHILSYFEKVNLIVN